MEGAHERHVAESLGVIGLALSRQMTAAAILILLSAAAAAGLGGGALTRPGRVVAPIVSPPCVAPVRAVAPVMFNLRDPRDRKQRNQRNPRDPRKRGPRQGAKQPAGPGRLQLPSLPDEWLESPLAVRAREAWDQVALGQVFAGFALALLLVSGTVVGGARSLAQVLGNEQSGQVIERAILFGAILGDVKAAYVEDVDVDKLFQTGAHLPAHPLACEPPPA